MLSKAKFYAHCNKGYHYLAGFNSILKEQRKYILRAWIKLGLSLWNPDYNWVHSVL
jgi:hypothetical protein